MAHSSTTFESPLFVPDDETGVSSKEETLIVSRNLTRRCESWGTSTWCSRYDYSYIYSLNYEGRTELLVRVCGGGAHGKQSIPCETAFVRFVQNNQQVKVTIQVAGPADRHDWGPRKTIDWLLEADFHIVSTHLHQGKFSSSSFSF